MFERAVAAWNRFFFTPRDPSTRFAFHELDNVLLSPHVAGWTTGTIVRRTLEMARNLDRLARGAPLENVIMQGARSLA